MNAELGRRTKRDSEGTQESRSFYKVQAMSSFPSSLNRCISRSVLPVALLLIGTPAQAEFSFQQIPDLGVSIIKMSADGRTVVGTSRADGLNNAAFWTQVTGTVRIGSLPGGDGGSYAFGVSADGRFIVGRSSSANGFEAFLWSADRGMTSLGDLPGGGPFNSLAHDVSIDGKTVVGQSIAILPFGEFQSRAFRWTAETGFMDLGNLGGQVTAARAVSRDGKLVVGQARSAVGDEAFMWTAESGMTSLGALPGGGRTLAANAISANGQVIVGLGADFSFEAFQWRSGNVMTLGTFDRANPGSEAFGVSADGAVIVGQGSGRDADGAGEASVWFPGRGQLNLRKYLLDHGVTAVQSWLLVGATGVSDDGRTIVGYGVSPQSRGEAWIARIEIDDVTTTPPNPPVVTPPAAPSNLTAVANTSQVVLRWIDNANNETGFGIERCQGVGCTNFAQIAQVNADTQSFLDGRRAKNTEYRYRVRAFNVAGRSAYSNVVTVRTLRR